METRVIGTTGVHVSVWSAWEHELEDDPGWTGARHIFEAALGSLRSSSSTPRETKMAP